MAKEDDLVEIVYEVARTVLASPLRVERHAVLLYQITLDNELNLSPDIKKLPHPVRGQSAFETDLCVYEDKPTDRQDGNRISIPRVVMEFKRRISTHDVSTYSAKARRHKQVYPYLRYGLIICEEEVVPGRVFTHNEAFDFCAAIAEFRDARLSEFLVPLLKDEVECSRRLERIAFGKVKPHLFRTEVIVKAGGTRVT